MVFGVNFQSGVAKRYYCEVCERGLGVDFESKDSVGVVTQQALHQFNLAIQMVPKVLVDTQKMSFS